MNPNRRPNREPRKKLESSELARLVASAARDMKAIDVVVLDVAELAGYTDYMVIASGRSTRQASSIADHVARTAARHGHAPTGIEGKRDGNWILIDCGPVVCHVFHQPVREFYELEKLWGDAERLELQED